MTNLNYENMESNLGKINFDVKLKQRCFDEFAIHGIPVPPYQKSLDFVLKFENPDDYFKYRNLLETILNALQLADQQGSNYDIQRSKAFIQNILIILEEQFVKIYN